MKARKIAYTTVCAALAALAVGNLGSKMYKKRELQKLHDEAAADAQEYIMSKYGFSSDMTDETEYPDRQRIMKKYDTYEFSSEHDGRQFYVWVNKAPDKEVTFLDSYQYEDIAADIKSRIQQEFPASYVPYLWFGSKIEQASGLGLYGGFSEYYDGTDPGELIKQGSATIELCVAEGTLEGSGLYSWLNELGFTYCMTTFDTAEHLDEFSKLRVNGGLSSFIEYEYAAPYITDHMDNFGDEVKRLDMDVIQGEEFMYAYLPTENMGFPASEAIAPPSKLTNDYFTGFFEYGGSKYSKAYDERGFIDKPVSSPWHFDCRYGDVMIYYPLDKLSGYDIDEVRTAWFSHSGFSNNRNIEKMVIFGDYAVMRLELGDTDFMLVDMSGKDEYIPAWADNSVKTAGS